MFTVALPSAACTFLAGKPWESLALLSCARNLHLSPSWNRWKRERSSFTAVQTFIIHVHQLQVVDSSFLISWWFTALVSAVQMWNTPGWRCKPHMDLPDVDLCCDGKKLNDVIWTATETTSSWNLSLPFLNAAYTIKYFQQADHFDLIRNVPFWRILIVLETRLEHFPSANYRCGSRARLSWADHRHHQSELLPTHLATLQWIIIQTD